MRATVDSSTGKPSPVPEEKVDELLQILLLPGSWERRGAILTSHGYLEGNHIRASLLRELFETWAVVRLDPETKTLLCLTSCDQSRTNYAPRLSCGFNPREKY